MKSTGKRLLGTVKVGFTFLFALSFVQTAQAASEVPTAWAVAPMTNGAYRESFEGSTITWGWAEVGRNAVTNIYPTMVGSPLPVRSNAWFSADSTNHVLYLDTNGQIVTNTLTKAGGGAVTFEDAPVYVDMRIRFEAVTEDPSPTMLANSKLALFVDPDCKLIAFHAGGTSTNATPIDTNVWNQVTIKLINGKGNVYINDVLVFSNLTMNDAGTSNTLSAVEFYGTGMLDELYVSHGDPAYPLAGPTNALSVTLPATGVNIPTGEQQMLINNWLDGNNVTALEGGMTQDALSAAYLLNNLDVTTVNDKPYTLGIKKLEMISTTLLAVTVELKVDGVAKSGKINGKIQLQGKKTIADGTWTVLPGAVTPEVADFTGGEATYTFAIPAGGYKFFKPAIVP